MKLKPLLTWGIILWNAHGFADPRLTSWLTTYSGQYARVYTNATMQAAGTALSTWSNGSQLQSLPAYCGVQEVYSSSNWVYVRTTGLASYTMGPWYLNAQHTQLFPNLPVNQKWLYRFPRVRAVPASKVATGGGAIGVFVDGVAMFNSWDAYYWNGTADTSGGGSGYWNRDAYVNESATFDPGNAHQQNTGTYHYHANPIALRYLLGDHVDYNPLTKTYSEDPSPPLEHSPLLAWTADGFPLYGPYGYSNPTNPASGIRRMISGYVLRNGQDGTENLALTGRNKIPAWAARLFNVSSNQTGPNVSSSYPLGRYMEDNDYLGDLVNPNTGTNFQPGTDFDLDQYNGRWCVTPEFPDGTYAYFVAISSNGAPVFPYNIGRGFYGSPSGGNVSAITEPVATNYLAYTHLVSTMAPPKAKDGIITLTWSAIEGGSYQLEATTNLAMASSWTVVGTNLLPDKITGAFTNSPSSTQKFYRVGRTGVAPFDSAGTTTFGIGAVAPGGGANRGSTVLVTITLPTTPPWPPANAPVSSVTLAGNIKGTNFSDSTQGEVVATLTIPPNAATGAQNVVVIFQNPGPTYTLTNAFTIY